MRGGQHWQSKSNKKCRDYGGQNSNSIFEKKLKQEIPNTLFLLSADSWVYTFYFVPAANERIDYESSDWSRRRRYQRHAGRCQSEASRHESIGKEQS